MIPLAEQATPDQPDRHRKEHDHEGEAPSEDDATTRGNAPPEVPDPRSVPELDETLERLRERAHSNGRDFIRQVVRGSLSGAVSGVVHHAVTQILNNITN